MTPSFLVYHFITLTRHKAVNKFSLCRFQFPPHEVAEHEISENTWGLSSSDQEEVPAGSCLRSKGKHSSSNQEEVPAGSCLRSKGKHCSEEQNHLLRLLLRLAASQVGHHQFGLVLLCLHNLDAVFMQTGPFVILNFLQLEGCLVKDI